MNRVVWRANRFLVDVAIRPIRSLALLGELLDFGRTYRTVFVIRPAG